MFKVYSLTYNLLWKKKELVKESLFISLSSALKGVGWWTTRFDRFNAGKIRYLFYTGWVFFGPFWMSAENVTSGIRSPDSHPVAFPYTQYDIPAYKIVKI